MRVRKMLVRTLIVLTLVTILGALGIRWLVRSDPSWYRPVKIDPAVQAQRYKELESQILDLRNRVGQSHVKVLQEKSEQFPAFDVEITEDQINGTVSRWRDWGPLADVSRQVREPHLRFLEDRIELAGRVGEGGPLISIAITVEQTDAGPVVEMGRPYAGRLPLSRSPLESLQAELEPQLTRTDLPAETAAFLRALLSGESTPPVVAVRTSVQGERDFLPARVERLTLENGVLRATLRPFEPTAE